MARYSKTCRICGAPVPKPRYAYCSDSCFRESRRRQAAGQYARIKADPARWERRQEYWREYHGEGD